MEKIESNGLVLYKWQVGPSCFLVAPEQGARLLNWHIRLADQSVRDVIYWPINTDFSQNIFQPYGGNSILFPFAGRSFDQGMEGFWKTDYGMRFPMPTDGFARNGRYKIVEVDDIRLTLEFIPSPQDQASYPFNYSFFVKYRFNELSLRIDMELHNKDSRAIPWAAGQKLFFQLPWHERLTKKDYLLDVPSKKAYQQTLEGQLEPVREIKKRYAFDDVGLNHMVFSKLQKNMIVFGPKGEEQDVKLYVGDSLSSSIATSIVTWSRDKDPFYCLEPLMCFPNSRNAPSEPRYVGPYMSNNFSIEVSLI